MGKLGGAFEENFSFEGVRVWWQLFPEVQENLFVGGGAGYPGGEFIREVFIVCVGGVERESKSDMCADVGLSGVLGICDGVEDGVGGV